MKIQDLMQTEPATCQPWDSLDKVAGTMWSTDLGWLPVVDDQQRLVGTITDRDVCMHAATTGKALSELSVRNCMQHDIVTCGAGDSLEAALSSLSERQVHRLPVVDANGLVVGVFTLGDVARAWRTEKAARTRKALGEKAWEAVAAVRRPHDEPQDVVVPAPRAKAEKAPAASSKAASEAPAAPKATKPAGRTAGKRRGSSRTDKG